MPATDLRTLCVKLSNKILPAWARWTLRAPALQCRAAITFHRSDNKQDIFGRAMEGRWTDSPQPTVLQSSPEAPRIWIIPEPRTIVVYPGESARLDIAVRVNDDENSYGFNDEAFSCTPTWRNPNWKLSQGTYLVKVVVTSSGQQCARWFSLANSAPSRTAFRLESAPS
jgi:hypothetical protein